jgi:glyoxylase-like metal-dependent hydrolase (beta-lactamase superfamily II)
MRRDDVFPLHMADITYPEGHPLAGTTGPVNAFAIRLPNGLVMVDTGIGSGNDWIEENYQPHGRAVKDALRSANLDADAVRMIINTHLHFDHCGQNSSFPGVPIVVQHAEWDVAWDDGHTITEWLDFEGARYERVSGDVEVAPGIRVLATPGHTPGHQSVTVETDEGLVLIVGQAAQDARAFATGAADASVQRLRDLNAERIHFSHERATMKRMPKSALPKN